MKLVALLALLMLAACSDPRFGAAIEADGSGLSITPTASGNFGGLTVSVRG